MALQTINRGTTANDGTGDDARTWADKSNANFTYLENLIGSIASEVENAPYANMAALYADQANQNVGKIQYVLDASAHPDVSTAEARHFEYLGTTVGDYTDYRLLSYSESTALTNPAAYRTFTIEALQDDGTPLTTVSNTKISFEFNGVNITGIVFNSVYTDALANFYNTNCDIQFYNITKGVLQKASILNTDWTTVNTDYYRIEITPGDILLADLSVNDRIEFGITQSGSGISNVVEDTTPQLGGSLDTNSKSIEWSKGADVASATELLLLRDGNSFDVTGTTTIETIEDTADAWKIGSIAVLQFDGILTLTHSADLSLPTGANITTAAGDIAFMQKVASGDWKCVSYQRADGTPLAGGSSYQINVLDFISDATAKAKVIARDNTQSATNVTAGVNAAISYCSSNNIKELHFNDGLYIIDKITIDDLDDFRLIGHGATIQYNSGDSIIEFTNCSNVYITGFEFTSTESSYSDVAFLRLETSNAYFKIFNNKFSNFPRCGILANNLSGGVYTEGITVYMNEFLSSDSYTNDTQCGVELGDNGEYSKVINNNFYDVPSAVRFTDGANGLFAYNNCLLINGEAYDSSYDNAIIYAEYNGNSGKIDILYNKINHNTTGIAAIVVKGDPTKPQNAIKIQGNDILVHGSSTKSTAIYLTDAPNSLITDNKLRGDSGTPNSTSIIIKNSDNCDLDNLYLQYFANGIELDNSSNVTLGNILYENISTSELVFDTDSSSFTYTKKPEGLTSLDGVKTISNNDDRDTIYNYTGGSIAVTIPTSGLKDDLIFKLDAVSADITVSEGSNTFLPSGDKTISAGDYAIVYKVGNTDSFRFLEFTSVGGSVSAIADGSSQLAAIESKATTEGFTQPSSGTKTALQTFIASLISAGAWDAADLILMFSYNDTNCNNFSRINLKTPTDTLATLTNSPTYSVNGFAGNGSNAYIDTNYNPSTYAGNFSQNDATRIAVLFSATSDDTATLNRIDGVTTGTSNLMFNANSVVCRLNSSSNLNGSADLTGSGLKAITRQDSTNCKAYNGATESSRTATSSAPDNENLLIFRDRTNYGDCGIGLYIVGSDMSTMMADIRSAYNTYLTAISLSAFA